MSLLTSIDLALAGEGSLGSLGVDGIILSGHSGDGVHQHLEGVRALGVTGGGVQVILVTSELLLSLGVHRDLVSGGGGQVAGVGGGLLLVLLVL